MRVHEDRCVDSLLVSLHEAVASARRRHRSLISAAGQWALARGASQPADHIALWAATSDELGSGTSVDSIAGPWRASRLPDHLADVANWCVLAGCSVPSDLRQSLWHLYGFLADTGRLHPASDSLTELRAAIVVFGTFDHCPSVPPPEPTAA